MKKSIHWFQTSGVAIVGAMFIVTAIATPTAQALTCNGDTITLSPGCTPLYWFKGITDGGDPTGGVGS